MPNQRDKSKKLVGLFATESEKKALQKAAKQHGFANLADFLRAVASGTVKVSPHVKALALSALGASSQGGCGPLLLLIIGAAVLALYSFV